MKVSYGQDIFWSYLFVFSCIFKQKKYCSGWNFQTGTVGGLAIWPDQYIFPDFKVLRMYHFPYFLVLHVR